MFIESINKSEKNIIINIPLTTPSGKIRVKQRNSIFDYGLPFASKQQLFNQKNYIEWQIGYDALVPKDVNKFKKEKFKNFYNTTLKENYFIDDNGKKKTLYELSEYLYYFVEWKVISTKTLQELQINLTNIVESDLLDKHQHCQIKQTNSSSKTINNIDFHALTIKHPQLVYKFGDEVIAEITIREKQRAVGTQPMLYFCFPITQLQANQPLIGRYAEIKEFAQFEFNENNAFIVLEMIKIFGMLSASHQHDTTQIIQTILGST